jgi:hypothetical protein
MSGAGGIGSGSAGGVGGAGVGSEGSGGTGVGGAPGGCGMDTSARFAFIAPARTVDRMPETIPPPVRLLRRRDQFGHGG